ncbi:MAG: hypothetical protein IPL53_20150, partial [Ignavibacteria bacterium]|nr:hypothetical protein [Ignavibacteria bacterium]
SINTWSAAGVSFPFAGIPVNYDFTSSSSTAYGGNLKLEGSEWTIYSGDVNKDGTIDLTDIVAITNDASSFVTGYVVTDVNGDSLVTLTDLLIAYNNAAAFVEEKSPL